MSGNIRQRLCLDLLDLQYLLKPVARHTVRVDSAIRICSIIDCCAVAVPSFVPPQSLLPPPLDEPLLPIWSIGLVLNATDVSGRRETRNGAASCALEGSHPLRPSLQSAIQLESSSLCVGVRYCSLRRQVSLSLHINNFKFSFVWHLDFIFESGDDENLMFHYHFHRGVVDFIFELSAIVWPSGCDLIVTYGVVFVFGKLETNFGMSSDMVVCVWCN